ncbi:HypC/HybG/HupF family hydrogenase formation chaperone [Ferrimonas pelagia]|uniref:HypC/HybG/HupF family hydrogenase formation chaperone n=1 Tax=Ferrimonas pelagia TaxID=1177826 RepID=A0ABP9EFI2_9GAMM
MCFAVPSKVLSLEPETDIAEVDTLGRTRHTSVHLLPEIKVGDYVLISHGFAMEIIDEARALDSLQLYREIVEKMEAGTI